MDLSKRTERNTGFGLVSERGCRLMPAVTMVAVATLRRVRIVVMAPTSSFLELRKYSPADLCTEGQHCCWLCDTQPGSVNFKSKIHSNERRCHDIIRIAQSKANFRTSRGMQGAFYLPSLSTIRQWCRNRVTTTTTVSTGSHITSSALVAL